MKIALLGATGRTGRLVLADAKARGHEVIALVRNPEKLIEEGVSVIGGDIRDLEAMTQLMEGADAVISAVGARGRDHDLHTTLARNTINAMTSNGISRFVGVSVGGLDIPGDRKGPRDRFIGALARTLAGPASADRQREYQAWQASSHSWTLIRVPRLMDRPGTDAPAVDAHIPPRRTTLGRPALAALLVDYSTGTQFTGLAPFAADN